jgi:exopolysaccharide biosynthesis protein
MRKAFKNQTRSLLFSLLLTCFFLFSISAFALDRQFNFTIADGVWHQKWQTDSTGVIRNINIIKIDYTKKDLALLVTVASTASHERTSAMAARNHAIAAINGGYFNFTGSHVGLVMQNGKIVNPNAADVPARGAIGFTPGHRIVIDRVDTANNKLTGLNGTDWSDVTQALGGGPVLVFKGQPVNWWKEESMGDSFNTTRHPRTAIGVTKDTTVYLVVIDGRQPGFATGISLDDFARFFVDQLHCEYALNLDGGGSSTMVVENKVINSVSDRIKKADANKKLTTDPDNDPNNVAKANGPEGVERPVTNAILVKHEE